MKSIFPDAILKFLFRTFYKPFLEVYLRKERTFTYQNLRIKVFSGVFHPGFFFSTKILLSFLETHELKGKKFLELGAGSGLLSIYAASKRAFVTATDISINALENISVNKELNQVHLEQIHSDLFDQVPPQVFDFIVINPPYYRGKIKNEPDHAWFAGERLEYFQKLFRQLPKFLIASTNTFMILSDECEVDAIEMLAAANHLVFRKVCSKKIFWETNFILKVELQN